MRPLWVKGCEGPGASAYGACASRVLHEGASWLEEHETGVILTYQGQGMRISLKNRVFGLNVGSSQAPSAQVRAGAHGQASYAPERCCCWCCCWASGVASGANGGTTGISSKMATSFSSLAANASSSGLPPGERRTSRKRRKYAGFCDSRSASALNRGPRLLQAPAHAGSPSAPRQRSSPAHKVRQRRTAKRHSQASGQVHAPGGG